MKPFLIVEDDAKIRKFIDFSLRSEGYSCIESKTGKEAMQSIVQQEPCCIILDLGLPDMDGIMLLKQVRAFSNLPIIIVSARDQDHEKVQALDLGADDYLTKPFSIQELLARIRVVFRHKKESETVQEETYNIGDLLVDPSKRQVLLNGREIHFTPMEYQILLLLVRHPGRVLTHNMILKEVWGSYLDSDRQSLRVFMANIRRKLERNPAVPRYIFTEIGVGYRFAEK